MEWLLLLGQLGGALVLAPLLTGLIKAVKARCQNRRGPGLLQPTRDLLKFLAREDVVSEHASWLFRAAPALYFGAHVVAMLLVPTVLTHPPLAWFGDAVVLVGLLALARFALALAGLDTASNFGGMGTSREMLFASLVEPALLLALVALAIPVGSTAFADMTAERTVTVARLLVLGSLFIVVVAETGRIPIDNPDTHLELTMAHEGMLLEYSGRPLGLIMWATHLKQLVVLSLLAALCLPWGLASQPALPDLGIGLVAYVIKMLGLGLTLALVETAYAKLRIFLVPELLGAASLLGLMAVASVYVVGG